MPERGRGRARLNPDDIVAAAVGLIDLQGAEELTMRRLGAAVGTEAMAIYRYFPSRHELIDAIVERVVGDATAHPGAQLRPADDWRDYLDRLAHAVRRVALAHPRVFPLVATHPTQAPWIRPPLRSLTWVDGFLSGLQEHHFPPPAAVTVYKQFCTFLLGHLLLEVAALGLEFPDNSTAPSPPPDRDARAARDLRRRHADEAERASADGAIEAEQVLERSTQSPRTLAEEPVMQAAGETAGPSTDAVTLDADVPVTAAMVSTEDLDLDEFPHVRAAAGLLAQDTAAADFERHLDWLLDEFAALRRG